MATSRTIVILLNGFFFLLGCGILSIGLWSQYDKNFSTLWNSFEVSRLLDARGVNGASLLFIITGLASILLSFLGLFGSLKKDKCFLSTYCLLISIILILEVAAVSVFISYKAQSSEHISLALNKTMDKINKENDTASMKIMDTIQTVFHCCGANGPADYVMVPAPASCIASNGTMPSEVVYYQNGCYSTIIHYINTNFPILLGITITTILFQLFCLALSIRTCASFRHEGYEDI
jgi:CD63 antigen